MFCRFGYWQSRVVAASDLVEWDFRGLVASLATDARDTA